MVDSLFLSAPTFIHIVKRVKVGVKMVTLSSQQKKVAIVPTVKPLYYGSPN